MIESHAYYIQNILRNHEVIFFLKKNPSSIKLKQTRSAQAFMFGGGLDLIQTRSPDYSTKPRTTITPSFPSPPPSVSPHNAPNKSRLTGSNHIHSKSIH